jgi:hypothetical protein
MSSLAAHAVCLLGVALGGCVVLPPVAPLAASPDTRLLFEQRLVYAEAAPPHPSWEAWRLYESGRLVYTRSSAEPIERHVEAARLSRARAWLRQHDFELIRGKAPPEPLTTSPASGVCQVRLSTGLIVAGPGDPRYYACDALKELCFAR